MNRVVHNVLANLETGQCSVRPPIDIPQGDHRSHVIIFQLCTNRSKYYTIDDKLRFIIEFYKDHKIVESEAVDIVNPYKGLVSYTITSMLTKEPGRYTTYIKLVSREPCGATVLAKASFIVTVSKSQEYVPNDDEVAITKDFRQALISHLKNRDIHLSPEEHQSLDEFDKMYDDLVEMHYDWAENSWMDYKDLPNVHRLHDLSLGRIRFDRPVRFLDDNNDPVDIYAPAYVIHTLSDPRVFHYDDKVEDEDDESTNDDNSTSNDTTDTSGSSDVDDVDDLSNHDVYDNFDLDISYNGLDDEQILAPPPHPHADDTTQYFVIIDSYDIRIYEEYLHKPCKWYSMRVNSADIGRCLKQLDFVNHNLTEKLEKLEKRTEKLESRTSKLDEKLKDLDKKVGINYNELSKEINRVSKDLHEHIDEVKEDLENFKEGTTENIDELNDKITEINERLDNIDSQIQDIEDTKANKLSDEDIESGQILLDDGSGDLAPSHIQTNDLILYWENSEEDDDDNPTPDDPDKD